MGGLQLVACGLALGACGPNGEGRVDAVFDPPECPPGETEDTLRDYGFEPQFYATDRFFEVVLIQVQRFRVDIFETDAVGVRLDLEGLERAGRLQRAGTFYEPTQAPLTLAIGAARDQAEVLLSLFRTCERFPGYSAVSGQVVFDALRLRLDGTDTGDNERIAGRVVDAQLSFDQAPAPIAVLNATFDFEPPRRPLREFE